MKFKFTAELDRDAVLAAAMEAAIEALEAADPGSISGIGADGSSEYETIGWELDDEGDGVFTISVEVERITGKFAGRDEVESELLDALESAATEHLAILE